MGRTVTALTRGMAWQVGQPRRAQGQGPRFTSLGFHKDRSMSPTILTGGPHPRCLPWHHTATLTWPPTRQMVSMTWHSSMRPHRWHPPRFQWTECRWYRSQEVVMRRGEKSPRRHRGLARPHWVGGSIRCDSASIRDKPHAAPRGRAAGAVVTPCAPGCWSRQAPAPRTQVVATQP